MTREAERLGAKVVGKADVCASGASHISITLAKDTPPDVVGRVRSELSRDYDGIAELVDVAL
jgi:hypothetical protein